MNMIFSLWRLECRLRFLINLSSIKPTVTHGFHQTVQRNTCPVLTSITVSFNFSILPDSCGLISNILSSIPTPMKPIETFSLITKLLGLPYALSAFYSAHKQQVKQSAEIIHVRFSPRSNPRCLIVSNMRHMLDTVSRSPNIEALLVSLFYPVVPVKRRIQH